MCDICIATASFDPQRHETATAAEPLSNLPLPGGGSDDTPPPPPLPTGTLDQLADYLTTGFWAANDEDERSFADVIGNSSNHVITVDLTGISAAAQRMARWAMEAWELVADVQFTEVLSGGDITFDDDEDGAFVRYSEDGFGRLQAKLNVSTDWIATYGTTMDSYSYSTFVHELGHTLGLGHMGNYNGTSGGVTYRNDSYQVSVMSYIPQDQNSSVDASYALDAGPMMADILALQNLYGASDETEGDTTWGVGGTYSRQFVTLFSGIDDGNPATTEVGPIAFTLYNYDEDNIADVDLIDLRPSTTDDRLDLNAERFSDIGGLVGNLAIARDTVIENAYMGSGNDTVLGNSADNLIRGAGGADLLWGGEGLDMLKGGTGRDTLLGGAHNDRLIGQNGNDYFDSGEGNDIMLGGNGADDFFYGFGHDRDKVKDFTLGEDRLVFNAVDFGNQDAQDLVDTYGSVTGKGIRLDFGDSLILGADYNDTLILLGVYDRNALVDDIVFM
ncbi:M10 family metallopeptidase C-terminal domain-containing protein [Pelagibacterium sp.]|uniref:M10 family metallopeptidase C-terminal domain-containing protein n=1 Tax=Pelagibacterium sp. TaxID=1967288 RepID=UPI003A927E6C